MRQRMNAVSEWEINTKKIIVYSSSITSSSSNSIYKKNYYKNIPPLTHTSNNNHNTQREKNGQGERKSLKNEQISHNPPLSPTLYYMVG